VSLRIPILTAALLASCAMTPAVADTLNDKLEDAGKSITGPLRPGSVRFHANTGTASLDNAVAISQCRGGVKIWFNPDFDGANVTATYTLFACPRATASANYATECLPLNFDPDGGGADTNIMSDATDSLILYNVRAIYLGTTITDGDSDTPQATLWCMP